MIFIKLLRRAIALFVIFAIAFPAYVAGQIWWSGTRSATGKVDGIIVLGAAQYNGRPGEILTARLEHALQIYKAGQAPRIVTTGGRAPGDLTTEADAGERWLHVRGVKRITAIPEGRDTYASTQAYVEYAKRQKWEQVVIVTDPWHCYRAKSMARSLDFKASCSPSTTGPGALKTWKYFQRELLANMAFTLLGPDHSWSSIKSLESRYG